MDKRIKKIIQLGRFDDDGNFIDGDGAIVEFDDGTSGIVEPENIDRLYRDYAQQHGMDDDLDIDEIIDSMDDDDFDHADSSIREDAAYEDAEPLYNDDDDFYYDDDDELDHDDDLDGEDDFDPESEDMHHRKWPKRVLAAGLAAAAIGGVGYAAYNHLNPKENTRDVDDDQDKEIDQDKDQNKGQDKKQDDPMNFSQKIDYDTASFDEIMNSMDETDTRRTVSEMAMKLVENFHTETHKESNFRLVEDGETYLDLSFEEAMVLTTFANYSDPAELADILGNYEITSVQAQDILESARTKLITYYMNAVEPSGVAEIFQSAEDRAFFEQFESEVIAFNVEHSTITSDQVIKDVYYNYILDGATNYPNVNSMAKLLAFDTVYGGLNLVESASTEHTKFLEFHGEGEDAETKYYVEKVLGLQYDSLSDDQKQTYRRNIIESGTKLVDLLPTGETMTEDNSKQEELDATKSVTELVDQMGLCNDVNTQISEKIQSLNTMNANDSVRQEANITSINNRVSELLREAGFDDLAYQVDLSINKQLSDELLGDIRAASSEAAEAVENYEVKMGTIVGQNRPTMQQIVNAANRRTALLENYAGNIKDVATLINNRRHVEENQLYDGVLGYAEDGIPIYDSSVFDGMSQSEIDDFIVKNGKVIDESTSTKTERVDYNDLTEEEKSQVDGQKAEIEASVARDNASAEGQIAANSNANSSFYQFSPGSVTNDLNGEVYNLNGMSFVSGVSYAYAFGGNVPSVGDSQIQNAAEVAAENYINGLSADEKEAIANGIGSDWRAQIKNAFISGYISQMQAEISSAIAVGEDIKAANEQAKKEMDEENKKPDKENDKQQGEDDNKDDDKQQGEDNQQNNDQQQDNNNDQQNNDQQQDNNESNSDNTNQENDEYKDVTEGDQEVEDSVLPEQGNDADVDNQAPTPTPDDVDENPAPTPTPDDTVDNQTPAPAPDENDPNIGEQVQPGEQTIEDANGNSTREQAAPAPEEVQEPVQADEAQMQSIVNQAYEEQLSQEADVENTSNVAVKKL